VRIKKGEKFLAKRDGIDELAVRKQYWEFDDIQFDDAGLDQLNAYLSLLLSEAADEKEPDG